MNKLNKKYDDFILERNENLILELLNESILYLSEEMEEIISHILEEDKYNNIARIISLLDLSEIDSKMSYLNIGKDNNTIDFVDSDRVTGDELPIDVLKNMSKYRVTSIRIGRLAKKFIELHNKKYNLDNKFSDKEVEDFVNIYKSTYDFLKNGMDNFKLITDYDEIKEAYLEDNYYSEDGTLGSSCMRYESCENYFEIYSELLILKNPNGKIMGRAVIWTLLDGSKFMDRIYTNRDSDIILFIKYAKKNGFSYKLNQTSLRDEKILTSNDDYKEPTTANLESKTQEYKKDGKYYFPYMDTMKYFYWEEGIIRNFKTNKGFYVFLEDTEGEHECYKCYVTGNTNCFECDGQGFIYCNECDSDGRIDSDEGNSIACKNCNGQGSNECEYCEGIGSKDCSQCGGFNVPE